MRRLLIALVLVLCPLSRAAALTYETDQTRERGPFESIQMNRTSVDDAADDLTVFSRDGANTVPSVLADITHVSLSHNSKQWTIAFETAAPIPDDPGMPVNVDVFIDRPDMPNAPDGVYRAGVDTACMLLFGTVSKWHTQCWDYQNGKWQKGGTFPYLLSRGKATLYLPFTVLPQDAVGVRFFTLTSDNAGHDAIDVAPGDGLPPLPVDASLAPLSPQTAPTSMGGAWTIIAVVAAMAGAGAWVAFRKK
jgi:hypothetical protein